MLSILIPTRDRTCYPLVEALHRQAECLPMPYEIIVAEDGSRSQVDIIANHKVADLPHCRHMVRRDNVGRAAMRNLLIGMASGDLLLLMDADGRVVREDFLARYVDAARQHDVVCGGIQTPASSPDPSRTLRWAYERDYEARHGRVSREFRSFCFLITRRVAGRVRFDERFRTYGYEDVQYGIDLEAAGFSVHSIDNPLENADIEPNDVFLNKTEEALRTAATFSDTIGHRISLVRAYRRLRPVAWLIAAAYILFRRPMRHNLLSASPSLRIFAAYKLGYYAWWAGQHS